MSGQVNLTFECSRTKFTLERTYVSVHCSLVSYSMGGTFESLCTNRTFVLELFVYHIDNAAHFMRVYCIEALAILKQRHSSSEIGYSLKII